MTVNLHHLVSSNPSVCITWFILCSVPLPHCHQEHGEGVELPPGQAHHHRPYPGLLGERHLQQCNGDG